MYVPTASDDDIVFHDGWVLPWPSESLGVESIAGAVPAGAGLSTCFWV